MDHGKEIWILSIDGGGIRGLISAEVLAWLEKTAGRPLSDCFDLIAGTSSGSVIAGGLAVGPDGRQLVPAADLPDVFTKDGPTIFRERGLSVVSNLRWLIRPKHDIEDLRAVVERQTGSIMLSEVRNKLLLTAYDMRLGRPVIFQSWLSGPQNRGEERGLMEHCPTRIHGDAEDFKLVDAILASTAVPTFFAPVRIPRANDEHYALIDGYIYAINPMISAYFAARRLYGNQRKVKILSVGTGKVEKQYSWEMIRDWGAARWLRPMFQIFPDGMSDASETYMQWMSEISDVEYVRISAVFDKERNPDTPSPEMDDASPGNLRKLSLTGQRLIEENRDVLERIVGQLTATDHAPESAIS